jgi:hypothetical protein
LKKKNNAGQPAQRQNSGNINPGQHGGQAQKQNQNPAINQETWKERERNPQPMPDSPPREPTDMDEPFS